jgi:hypothetical protein
MMFGLVLKSPKTFLCVHEDIFGKTLMICELCFEMIYLCELVDLSHGFQMENFGS